MKIVDIEAIPFAIPYKTPLKFASGEVRPPPQHPNPDDAASQWSGSGRLTPRITTSSALRRRGVGPRR
ncbi:hypothetical protein AB0I54_47410 [Streptomyces sp. NPDC050625]|uniref:hypothetical protein n=1 Tax=Streptomyces sp. NPDC050625 TaxID=3154629 RepID=UPI003438846B